MSAKKTSRLGHVTLLLLLIGACTCYITNGDVFECYMNVEEKCGDSFQACAISGDCMGELKKYQKCTIPQEDEQKNEIFNGFCFREWWNQAEHSRALIDCLVSTCGLTYNSIVSNEIMVKCTEWVLFQEYVPCEDACMQEIEEKVGKKSRNTPIEEIYTQKFEDKEAQDFIDKIKRDCISPEGRFRKMVPERQASKEERVEQESEQL